MYSLLIWIFLLAGGTTYCCVASFALASRLSSLPNARSLRRWLVSRQVRPPVPAPDSDSEESEEGDDEEPVEVKEMAGFQGRIGKDTDACYSFWCSAALKVSRSLLGEPLLQRRR